MYAKDQAANYCKIAGVSGWCLSLRLAHGWRSCCDVWRPWLGRPMIGSAISLWGFGIVLELRKNEIDLQREKIMWENTTCNLKERMAWLMNCREKNRSWIAMPLHGERWKVHVMREYAPKSSNLTRILPVSWGETTIVQMHSYRRHERAFSFICPLN